MLINSTSAFRPAFVEDPEQWYNIFFPGNSNGSIFELNFDQSRNQSPDDDATASTYPSPSNVILGHNRQLPVFNSRTQCVSVCLTNKLING